MRAMVCRAWGAPDVLQLENVPSRALRPGEVRIRVRAAGVNFADSLMVGGTYQVKPPFPFTPGLEAAGEVIETGDGVPSLRTGQRVLAVERPLGRPGLQPHGRQDLFVKHLAKERRRAAD
jgi:NADPH2:quinone reductase